jgi:hypothetical protein
MTAVGGIEVTISLYKPILEQLALYTDVYNHYDEAYRIRSINVGGLGDPIVTLE